MNQLTTILKKMRQHVSSKEFKRIEAINLWRLIPKLLKVSIYLMVLLMLRWGILETFDSLLESAGKVEIAALYMTSEILLTLLHITLILMVFIVIPIRMNQDKNYLLMKDYFYLGIIFLAATLPVSINITAQQGDYLMLACLLCLVLLFIIRRIIYLKELNVLIELGVIDAAKSQISFFRIKKLTYLINTLDKLSNINHDWLPFITVEMSETNQMELSHDWYHKLMSHNFSIVVQSKFSGLKIYHNVLYYPVKEKGIMTPKNTTALNESEEK